MITEAVQRALSAGKLLPRGQFHPIPALSDRAAWEAVAPKAKAHYEALKPDYLNRAYPPLSATRYMDFTRDGNRTRYQDIYYERRTALYVLLIARALTGADDVLDAIADLIWAICEETSWVIPAHNNHRPHTGHPRPIALPDIEEDFPYVDLFSAETASLLAWTHALMKDDLDSLSPILARRIELEIDRRVLAPFLARDDMRWMGFYDDEPVNNWNPWINSNVIACALLMEPDEDRRAALLLRAARSLDRFLSFYPSDGGCDEGPAYFGVAGASLLDALELFDLATGGEASVYEEPLIQNIARYIMYAHISGPYYTNFADAAAIVRPDAMLLRRAAKRMKLTDLESFAAGILAEGSAALPYAEHYDLIYRRLRNLLDFRPEQNSSASVASSVGENTAKPATFASSIDKNNAKPVPVPHPLSHAFPGRQIAMARENADGKGLYFAAKGGCNGESHNHNDIGNYIVYVNGVPALCDAGVETYRRETFSAQRYTIWTMQSRYHNTAIIGGCDQKPGQAFAGRDFSFRDENGVAAFSVDIAGAYGEEAGVEKYVRAIALDRTARTLTVTDEFRFSAPKALILPLMCAERPALTPGRVRIPAGASALILEYDETLFSASFEEVPIPDASLQRSWQRPCLYRLLLTAREKAANAKHVLRLREEI